MLNRYKVSHLIEENLRNSSHFCLPVLPFLCKAHHLLDAQRVTAHEAFDRGD
jgi:hypothetical protein